MSQSTFFWFYICAWQYDTQCCTYFFYGTSVHVSSFLFLVSSNNAVSVDSHGTFLTVSSDCLHIPLRYKKLKSCENIFFECKRVILM